MRPVVAPAFLVRPRGGDDDAAATLLDEVDAWDIDYELASVPGGFGPLTHLTCFPRLLAKTAFKYSPGQQTMNLESSIRVYLGNEIC